MREEPSPPIIASLPPAPVRTRNPDVVAPSRAHSKAITGWFPPEVQECLRDIQHEERKRRGGERVTINSLLGEALNLLFEKYKKAPIISEN